MNPDIEVRFRRVVEPLVERRDVLGLLFALNQKWTSQDLLELFSSDDPLVVRLALICVGLVGDMGHSRFVAHLLTHEDGAVAAAAENALWNIWMRAGSDDARSELSRAVRLLQGDQPGEALAILESICAREPEYAEVHHQRAIALHTLGRLDEARCEYNAAAALNPQHFAALAALGHICIDRSEFVGALKHYRDAVAIHPNIPDLPELLPKLELMLQQRSVA
ncbi:MAG: tetratricopeptide repeat protein [Planctomycetes bacterium]|nr:tetratricopeptide repeat protein [Planctomycetota bacterium]